MAQAQVVPIATRNARRASSSSIEEQQLCRKLVCVSPRIIVTVPFSFSHSLMLVSQLDVSQML